MFGRIISKISDWSERKKSEYQKTLFKSCGNSVIIDSGCRFFGYENISIGNNVYINVNAVFMTTESEIHIGNYVMFGANVCIVTGDHRTDVVGKYMMEVCDKLPENDLPVTICDDVWIGSNATVLKGVTIGRGSVIGAGSVVTKDVPPYSVCVGNPAAVIRRRFDEKTAAKHEELIGK